MYFLTPKGHLVTLTSGHPRSRSRIDLKRSCRISIDAYWWEVHFGTYLTSLAHTNQKRIGRNVYWPYDVIIWPQLTCQGATNAKLYLSCHPFPNFIIILSDFKGSDWYLRDLPLYLYLYLYFMYLPLLTKNAHISISRKYAQKLCIGKQSIHHQEYLGAKISVLAGVVFFISLNELMPPVHHQGHEQALQIPINTSTKKIFTQNLGVRNMRWYTGFLRVVIIHGITSMVLRCELLNPRYTR